MTETAEPPDPPAEPWHRWRVNEDMYFEGQDYCLACGVVRYPLRAWAQAIASGPCARKPIKCSR